MMHRHLALFGLALVLVTAPVAGSTTTTIDADHSLTSAESIQTYESDGVAVANPAQADVTITIAKGHDDAGLEGIYADGLDTYLRIDYDEDIDRTLRFYIPSEYVSPRTKRGLEPVDGGPPADLTPVRGGNMTAVTVEVDGQTDSVYRLSKLAGLTYSVRQRYADRIENRTGWEVPSLTSSTQWQYVEAGSYSTNSPRPINDTDLTMQYRQASADETEWLPVRKCDDPETQRVCYVQDTNTTLLMSSAENPPKVRYKTDGGIIENVSGEVEDMLESFSRAGDWFGDIFGGGN